MKLKKDFNDKNLDQRLKRNISIDYLYCFLRNFDLSSAIWVLYMVYRGLPLWQVGIVEGIFHATSLLCEMPSGALADLAGRRRVILWGRVLSFIATIVVLCSTELWQFCIGFMMSAISYNLNSGSEEALVYDSLKKIGEEKSYIKINGRLNMVIEIASGAAVFLGGLISEYSFEWCYLISIVIVGLSMIPAVLFKEVPVAEKRERTGFKKHFLETFGVIKDNPGVIKILLYYPAIEAFYAVVFFYGQQYFLDLGFHKAQIGVLMLCSGIVSCLGAVSSENVLKHLGVKTKYLIPLFMGISILFISMGEKKIAVAAFFIAGYLNSMIYPIASAALNEKIPSKHRATIISVDSMCFSIAMIGFFPVAGFVADCHGLGTSFFLLGIVEVLMTLFILCEIIKRGIFTKSQE